MRHADADVHPTWSYRLATSAPMSAADARHHRQRAGDLEALARRIENEPIWTLPSAAGTETWHGPRPRSCSDQLSIDLHRLEQAIDDLRRRARAHLRTADELDARARSDLGGHG